MWELVLRRGRAKGCKGGEIPYEGGEASNDCEKGEPQGRARWQTSLWKTGEWERRCEADEREGKERKRID